MHIMWICKEAKCGRPTTNPDETWWSHICNLDRPKAARFSATEIDIWGLVAAESQQPDSISMLYYLYTNAI